MVKIAKYKISNYICIINRHDVRFIFTLLSYHTSTSFGPILAHHQEVACIYVANGTCFSSKTSVCWPRPPTDILELKLVGLLYKCNKRCTVNQTYKNKIKSLHYGFYIFTYRIDIEIPN
jgi:hypothetical protein